MLLKTTSNTVRLSKRQNICQRYVRKNTIRTFHLLHSPLVLMHFLVHILSPFFSQCSTCHFCFGHVPNVFQCKYNLNRINRNENSLLLCWYKKKLQNFNRIYLTQTQMTWRERGGERKQKIICKKCFFEKIFLW